MGTCEGCGRDYRLTRGGLIRKHVHMETRRFCDGSGKKPKEV